MVGLLVQGLGDSIYHDDYAFDAVGESFFTTFSPVVPSIGFGLDHAC